MGRLWLSKIKLILKDSNLTKAVVNTGVKTHRSLIDTRKANILPIDCSDMIKITDKPIEIRDALDGASSLAAGAVNIFVGNIREKSADKKVLWLEYEAFESMAVSEIKKIIDQAKDKWEVKGYAVIHRIGTLKPGETAVVVAVSTGHRKESFEACSFIIDSLKQTVPIFKKEVFENGEEWVSAHP